MDKFNKATSPALKRNPQMSISRAKKCDGRIHAFIVYKQPNKPDTLACLYCGQRKGGLPPVKIQASSKVSGAAKTKGSLTAKKS